MPSTTTDLLNLQHAWITPDGEVHKIGRWEHDYYALAHFGKDYHQMKVAGFIKLSDGDWFWHEKGVTQAQLEVMYDWHVANQRNFDPSQYEIR